MLLLNVKEVRFKLGNVTLDIPVNKPIDETGTSDTMYVNLLDEVNDAIERKKAAKEDPSGLETIKLLIEQMFPDTPISLTISYRVDLSHVTGTYKMTYSTGNVSVSKTPKHERYMFNSIFNFCKRNVVDVIVVKDNIFSK